MTEFNRPWKEYTFVGFDTETTGKFPLVAEICEVAAVKWKDGQVIETYQQLVKPCRAMGEEVIRIHKITNEMVADSPPLESILPAFHSFIQGSILIAHNASFDMGFLTPEFERSGLPLPQEPSLDSCYLALKAFPESANHRLITLIQHLNIKQGQSHRALDDSRACLEVGLKCMEKLGANATLDYIFSQQEGGPLRWTRYSVKDLTEHPIYGNLVEGSRKQLVVEITYQGGSMAGKARHITPQGIVRNPKGDYVVGFCHIDRREKRFYLNRILTSKILD